MSDLSNDDGVQLLAQLARSSDPDVAEVAREFLAVFDRRYGNGGEAAAERFWHRLTNAWVIGGASGGEAQTRGIQELRQMLGIAEKTKKKGWLKRVFSTKS